MLAKMMLFYTLMLAVISVVSASNPIIKASAGTFEGTRLTAWNGKFYNSYQGIPYAKPPVGDLRFRLPVAVDYLDGLYDAKDFKPYCIQVNRIRNSFDLGQEDCLYLNVFTPRSSDRDDGDLKKVLVFFHGGGNTNGFPNIYIPGNVVTEHDIIVVTVAYRLGYLGLLSTMTPNCEGNFHLQDQLLSLRWVKENILDFGGDPNGITISGESAGAFDTSLLNLVPGSRDLFARAYSQSGTNGVQNSLLTTNPRPFAIKVFRNFGCLGDGDADPVTDSEFDNLVNCLRKLPALRFAENGNGVDLGVTFMQPVLYGDLFPKSIEELFSDDDHLKSIKFYDRDYLIGLDQNEGDILNILKDAVLYSLPENIRKTVTPEFFLRKSIPTFATPAFGAISSEVVNKIAEYYEANYVTNPLSDFGADALFHFYTLQYVTAAAAGRSPEDSRVYLFRFMHSPEYLPEPQNGIIHGFDLMYLYDVEFKNIAQILPLKLDTSKWTQNDDYLKSKFTSMIVDFVKTGNPGKSLNSELPSKWPGFDNVHQQYLEFGLKNEVKNNLLPERMKLWREQIPNWIKEFPITTEKHDEF